MDNSDDDIEEDETEWNKSFVDSAPASPATEVSGSNIVKVPHTPAHKVILHFDLDCFYAQVEMIRNPALRDVPLGIQQKYIIVTCNYVAREQGVTKLMSVTDAKEKCPQLVLVKGEDLTHYREMSYKVTELLMSFCPLVERLGFDENYMDVTQMVERRLAETPDSDCSFQGHVYNGAEVEVSGHLRLAVGSQIAAELRGAINSKLGLTGCAGIATNKLLAKLVSGTFKPNQQTTLLPGNVGDIMGSLSSLRKVPGVGHQTAKRLQALGVVSVKDLQDFPLTDLVREFGSPNGQRLKNLALGIDDSPVTPTGAPQSLSDEDSFKKMSLTKDVIEKIQQLLGSLVERMHQDGRQPQTFRLTIRRYSATNKWFSRESRQCPIPGHIGQKITSGFSDDAVALLLPMAMKLFHKMVDANTAFHLTLINVCFSNLQTKGPAAGGRGSITSFFAHSTSPRKTQEGSALSVDNHCVDHQLSTHSMITPTAESPRSSEATLRGFKRKQSTSVLIQLSQPRKVSRSAMRSESDEQNNTVTPRLPPNVDPDVFRLLPEDIQKELLSFADGNPPPTASVSSPVAVTDSEALESSSLCPPPSMRVTHSFPDSQKSPKSQTEKYIGASAMSHQCPPATSAFPRENIRDEGRQSSDYDFPEDVDPRVFSELPADVQKELASEWKQQKSVPKAPALRKPQRALMTKDKKANGKSSQANNLLNYFKPN